VIPVSGQIVLAGPGGWLWLAAVGTLILAAVAPLASRRLASGGAVLSTAAGLSILGFGIVVLVGGGTFTTEWGRVLGMAPIALHYDGLSAVFLVALGLTSAAASMTVVGTPVRSRVEASAYPLFLASMLLVLGARDAFSFLLAWELMALLSALLVVGLRPTRSVVSAGYLYLAMTHVATAALLVAFALLAAGSGGHLEFVAWRGAAPSLSPLVRDAVFVLTFVGFGTKAGSLPLHAWLPRAHPVAPSHVSALMSGVMIKIGIYGLVRILVDVLGGGPDWWGVAILVVGALSAVLGVLYALMQHDLKRLLAFHSIENIGIILLGLGAAIILAARDQDALAAMALAAALFHSINHAVFKCLLFLGAGAVLAATGLRDLNRLGGLARAMPITALAFGIGAAAISGLPPLNGFASEWLVFQGLLGAAGSALVPPFERMAAGLAMGALGLTSALAVACFVKATGVTFLGLPRSSAAAGAREAGRPARLALALLAAGCVALGLGAGPVVVALTRVAATLMTFDTATRVPTVSTTPAMVPAAMYAALAIGLLLASAVAVAALALRRAGAARRVDTWTCGIAPQPAFQYNATSFAKPIRLFFGRVLLPEREIDIEYHAGTSFPLAMRYRSEVTLILEDRVFRPAHALSVRFSMLVQRAQSGSLQLYLAYTVAAVLVLLWWAR
jgi:hydrogenase-4 component B